MTLRMKREAMEIIKNIEEQIKTGKADKVIPLTKETFNTVVEYGNLENMKWLHSVGCPWDEWTFAMTAKHRNFETIKWLHSVGCPWNNWTFTCVTERGDFEIIKWLHEQGCPWNEETFYDAAREGNLDIIKWLHEKGCPWDEDVLRGAAQAERLEIVKYLHENGCPVPVFTLDEFRNCKDYHKSFKIQEWLHTNDMLYLSDTSESDSEPDYYDDDKIMRSLRKHSIKLHVIATNRLKRFQ